jgi:predicted lipoprotein with Yx(FWY)xxD motif
MRTRDFRALVVAVLAAAVFAAPEMAATSSEAASPTLTVRDSRYGRILFDGSNRVLYAFTRDRRGGPSTCYGACAVAWPPYIVSGRLSADRGRGVRSSRRPGGATADAS